MLLIVFAVLAIGAIVVNGVFDYLLRPDHRTLVVTMRDGGEPARLALKAACGSLPGVTALPDQGTADPDIQGRFPVRFTLYGASFSVEAALEACVDKQPHVRGYLVEGDAT